MKFAIIDIETTGGTSYNSKITEISIFIHDGENIIDEFHTLVNPKQAIPRYIVGLTGITDDMVAHAPTFEEVSNKIDEITADCIFIAHNVNFDYSFVRDEMKNVGIDFKRKKACTVRLSRAVFPGFPSYSLGNICANLGIDISDRHRAEGDARATVKLFELILAHDTDDLVKKAVNVRSKEATLPPHLPKQVYEDLPSETGVYYFHDEDGKIIYIGKAVNIKQRIYSHFTGGKGAKLSFLQSIHDISYTVTGSELAALLLESDEIKKHLPKFNRAQRITGSFYCLYNYTDQTETQRLVVGKKANNLSAVMMFKSFDTARNYLYEMVEKYELCPKCCGLEITNKACFSYQLKKCRGVCAGTESIEDYNERVGEAIRFMRGETGDKIIVDRGRHREEKCIVVIKEGAYKGFGYVSFDTQLMNVDEALDHITQYADNNDVQRILRAWV